MNALLLCQTDPSGDPRPRRIAETLTAAGMSVDIASLPLQGSIPHRRHFQLSPPAGGSVARLLRRFRTVFTMVAGRMVPALHARLFAWRLRLAPLEQILASGNWDVIVVEDPYLLPLAVRVKGRARVIVDAREYFPRFAEHSRLFRLLQRPELIWLCRNYLPRCDAVVTVSGGLAHAFEREFGVKATVIRSVPLRQELPVNPVVAGRIRMVHHGVANRNRRLENLVRIATALDDRFTLDLYLTGDPAYIAELRNFAEDGSRVRILDPVPYERICPMLNEYDIGLFYVEPTTFNLEHCLPNKLFEFIQARLAVAIGPSPDMAAVVEANRCGVVAPEFSLASMVTTLGGLDEERIMELKHGSDRAAGSLNWEIEREKWTRLVGADGR